MMFGNQQANQLKGIRTTGFSGKKEGQFTLSWDVDQQLNEFQMRKQQREYGMAGKVGDHEARNSAKQLSYDERYNEIVLNNPNITAEELQELMAEWQNNRYQQYNSNTSRPYRPTESMKNIIFNPEAQQINNNIRTSKKNEGTLSLGYGYNYFTDQDYQK